MKENELYQVDLDLCTDSPCFRFSTEKYTPKCTNCPFTNDKHKERVQRINVINACRSQNKLK
jgi:hypothetical protein